MIFSIGDSTSISSILDTSSLIENGPKVYHLSVVYDLDNDKAAFYVYEKGVGGTNTTTASGIPNLVNYQSSNYPRIGLNCDARLDDFRVYNRALSEEEIWALQSQGY